MAEPALSIQALPHLKTLMERVFDLNADTPKSILKAVTQEYHGLSRIEKCAAARMLASSARVADPIRDERAYRLLNEARQAYRKHTGKEAPPIRLVIAESDLAQAMAGLFPGASQHSVIITSRLLELLDDRKAKATLCHELGHLHKDLKPSKFSQFILEPIKHVATRNATRRRMEFNADDFALSLTDDVDAVVNGLEQIREHNLQVAETLKAISSQKTHTNVKNNRIKQAADWLVNYVTDSYMDRALETQTRTKPFTRCEEILKAPRYPVISTRIDRIKASAEKRNQSSSPTTER
jgi:Zn-dependent protease with chaperone function